MECIGAWRRRAKVILQQFGLAPFRQLLTPADFVAVAAATGCSPKRERALKPEVVVWLMALTALATTSMTKGLSEAFGVIALACGPRLTCVTEEAFTQARNALPLRFWRLLWSCVRAKYEHLFSAQLLWKGLRVLACDGTEADVPNVPALVKFFTRPKTKRGESKAPQGRLVAVCSVFTGFCMDFVFTSRRCSEHLALQHLIRHFRTNDLILLDRGFFSYRALHSLDMRHVHCLMRLQANMARCAKRVQTLGPDDWLVEFHPSPTYRHRQPQLPTVFTRRLIRYQLKGYRPSWLLTSLLDPVAFPASELVNLYHFRWRIETIYREWKHGLDIQNLRSHTPSGIIKEMHAQLLLSNLVRWVMTEAAQGTGKAPVEFSFLSALDAVRDFLRMMSQPRALLALLYQQLLDDIRLALIRQRPDRHFPRPGEGKIKDKGHGKFRLPATLPALA